MTPNRRTRRPPVTLKWDTRFLEMARYISHWSKDPSTKCGCVIADGRREISRGYNGLPEGADDSPKILNDRTLKLKFTLHAESNALDFAERSVEGCTLYIWPCPPCSQCAARIVQRRIARVVSPKVPESMLDRWGEDMNVYASGLFQDIGIEQCYLELPNDRASVGSEAHDHPSYRLPPQGDPHTCH